MWNSLLLCAGWVSLYDDYVRRKGTFSLSSAPTFVRVVGHTYTCDMYAQGEPLLRYSTCQKGLSRVHKNNFA